MSVCAFETICSELYSLGVCVWTRTPRWGAERWLGASPCSATAAPCGVSRPGLPPRYGTFLSLSSTTCHGSSLWPVHLKRKKHLNVDRIWAYFVLNRAMSCFTTVIFKTVSTSAVSVQNMPVRYGLIADCSFL